MGRVWIIIIAYTSLMIGAAMVPVFWADDEDKKEEDIIEENEEISYAKNEDESDLHIISYSLKGSNKNVLVVETKFNMNYELNKIKCNLFNNGSIVKSLNSIEEISASKGDITDISFGFVREKFDHIECEPFKKVEFKEEPERKANIKEVIRNTHQGTQPQQNNKRVIQPKKVESDGFALPEL